MALDKIFEQTQNLPNIPKVVQELMDHFNDPDSNADVISKKVQMDQVISAKVLRLAIQRDMGPAEKLPQLILLW